MQKKKHLTWIGLVAVFLLHLSILLYSFPVREILSPYAITYGDFTHHFYACIKVSHFLSRFGKTWGYDPFFMAGYPAGIAMSLDNKIAEIFVWAGAHFFSPEIVYKLFILITYLSLPIVLYLAALNFNISRGDATLASLLGVLYWFLDPAIHNFWYFGMNSWAVVSFLGIYVISLFYEFLHHSDGTFFILTFWGALIFYFHPLSFFILIAPMLLGYLVNIKKLDKKKHWLILAFVGIVFVANLPWFAPLIHNLDALDSPRNISRYVFASGFRHFLAEFVFDQSKLVPLALGSRRLQMIIYLFGGYGLYLWGRRDRRFWFIFSQVLFLFPLLYFMGRFEFGQSLQSYRFVSPFVFFMIIPAIVGIRDLIEYFRIQHTRGKLLLGILMLLLIPTLTSSAYESTKFGIIPATMNESEKDIVKGLKECTDRSGRILFHLEHFRYFPANLPLFMEREFIGGFYTQIYLKHGFANFMLGSLFMKKTSTIPLSQLKKYFDLYNIKWVSTHFTEYFDRFPDYLINKRSMGNRYFYEVNREPSFFLKGQGEGKADYNEIAIKNASPGGVILKYHWHKDLVTEPPLPIRRHMAMDDPVGFIEVDNGNVQDFVIRLKY